MCFEASNFFIFSLLLQFHFFSFIDYHLSFHQVTRKLNETQGEAIFPFFLKILLIIPIAVFIDVDSLALLFLTSIPVHSNPFSPLKKFRLLVFFSLSISVFLQYLFYQRVQYIKEINFFLLKLGTKLPRFEQLSIRYVEPRYNIVKGIENPQFTIQVFNRFSIKVQLNLDMKQLEGMIEYYVYRGTSMYMQICIAKADIHGKKLF